MCPSGTYRAKQAHRDRNCALLSNCEPSTYVTVPGLPTQNRACGACPTGQFQANSNQPSCSTWRACTTEELEVVAPSLKSDRICVNSDGIVQSGIYCPSGQYITTLYHRSPFF